MRPNNNAGSSDVEIFMNIRKFVTNISIILRSLWKLKFNIFCDDKDKDYDSLSDKSKIVTKQTFLYNIQHVTFLLPFLVSQKLSSANKTPESLQNFNNLIVGRQFLQKLKTGALYIFIYLWKKRRKSV